MKGMVKAIFGIVFCIFALWFLLVCAVIKEINDSGGIKGIAVSAGKAMKDVQKEVEEYKP